MSYRQRKKRIWSNSGPAKKPDGLVQNFDWVREAPFWNVLALYRSCPNSFWTPLPSVPKTILESPYTPWQAFTTPPFRAMPIYGSNTFQKGAFLSEVMKNEKIISSEKQSVCQYAHIWSRRAEYFRKLMIPGQGSQLFAALRFVNHKSVWNRVQA